MSELERGTAVPPRAPVDAGPTATPAVHSQPAVLAEALDRLLATLDAAPPAERLPRTRSGEREEIVPEVRRGVWLRDGGRCSWCGTSERGLMQLDHIVPWSAGGSDRSDNLRVLCAYCNERRSNFRTDMAIARVIPVSFACSRCAWMRVNDAYATSDLDGLEALDDAPLERTVEYADPVAAFCVTCRFAGTAERSWTL
jgi:hypothetical protein